MQNCGLRMRPECRESFLHHRLQGKPLVSDPGMHYSTCIIHVPWCMSGSLTRGGGENVPDIPGACISAHEVCFAVWIGRSSFPYLNPTDGVAGHCDEAFWRNTSITSFKLVNVLFSPYLVQVTIDIFIALLIGTGSQQGKHQEKCDYMTSCDIILCINNTYDIETNRWVSRRIYFPDLYSLSGRTP